MKPLIVPSIIAQTQEDMQKKIMSVSFAPRIQIDVMDGVFVKEKSLWFPLQLPKIDGQYEAHLMVRKPASWIEQYGKGVHRVIVHAELPDALTILKKIRQLRKKAGIALNPGTSAASVVRFIDWIDQVTVMAVIPGRYGAPFISGVLEKIQDLKRLYPKLAIEIDGGMNPEHIRMAKAAGASVFISGSYLMNAKNPRLAIAELARAAR
ncbi:ribulose-phosphate 3-epimerase [Candidatus Woesearchaeota archaeon]|nr:ribulose-phosphate 3-epimerase [Candidatus Woesearchaeota archaeon]